MSERDAHGLPCCQYHRDHPCPTCAENAEIIAAARGLARMIREHIEDMRDERVVTTEEGAMLDSLLEAIKDE